MQFYLLKIQDQEKKKIKKGKTGNYNITFKVMKKIENKAYEKSFQKKLNILIHQDMNDRLITSNIDRIQIYKQ